MNKSVSTVLAGFLGHHVVDLSALSNSIGLILDAVPVNAGTKATIREALSRVEQSAHNISATLATVNTADNGGAKPVQIKASDIRNAIEKSDAFRDVVNELVAIEVRKEVERVTAPGTVVDTKGVADQADKGESGTDNGASEAALRDAARSTGDKAPSSDAGTGGDA